MKKNLIIILLCLFAFACQKKSEDEKILENVIKIEKTLNVENFKKYKLYKDLYNILIIEDPAGNTFYKLILDEVDLKSNLDQKVDYSNLKQIIENDFKNIEEVFLKLKNTKKENPKFYTDSSIERIEKYSLEIKRKLVEIVNFYVSQNTDEAALIKLYEDYHELFNLYSAVSENFFYEFELIETTRLNELIKELTDKNSIIRDKIFNFKIAAKIFTDIVMSEETRKHATENKEALDSVKHLRNILKEAYIDLLSEVDKYLKEDPDKLKYDNNFFDGLHIFVNLSDEIIKSIESNQSFKETEEDRATREYLAIYFGIILAYGEYINME